MHFTTKHFRSIFVTMIVCVFNSIVSIGQIPANPIGSNPSNLKWSQINTDKVQVIFPNGMDSIGVRVAQLIHHLWNMDQATVSDQKHKVPIILHGYNMRSNAFVTVGPFRSEFITTPPQFKNTMDWVDELTIHEYRHVQQFANATKGLTKMAKSIFGSWAWGGFLSTALPRWYLEGDAVIAETGLSNSGRGRFPEFNMEYHALIHDGIKYNYEKAAAGSIKDFVPNWYQLGYNMLAYGRENYGSNLWQQVASDAVKYKGLLYPFGKSLKRRTGLNPAQLYDKTYKDLSLRWDAENSFNKKATIHPINILEKKAVTNYNIPLESDDGFVFCFKTGYDRLFELIRIDSEGKESKLVNTGILLDRSLSTLSTNGKSLVWSELAFDKRWRNSNYSDIMMFHLASNEKIRLTKNKRYFSPDINKQGDLIVAVGLSEDFTQRIEIIQTSNGATAEYFKGNLLKGISYPKWISDEFIAYVLTQNQQNQIMLLNIKTGAENAITEMTFDHISHLYPSENKIYFSKAHEEVNNIFSVDIDNRQIAKHTDSAIGAFQPSISRDGNLLYYSEFTSRGYNIIKTHLEKKSNKSDVPGPSTLQYPLLSTQEGGDILGDKIEQEKFKIEKFNKLSGLINPHSLLPEWTENEFSLRLLSDNVFGTLSGELGAYYNYNENEFNYAAGFTYAELYPIFNVSYSKGNRNALFYNFSELTDTSFVQRLFIENWDENRLSTGVSLPFNFSKGDMINNLGIRVNYQNTSINIDSDEHSSGDIRRDSISYSANNASAIRALYTTPISDQTIHTLDVRFNVQMFKLKALQHIDSRLGLYFDVRYRANIGNNELGGNNFLARADVYLPGLARNHAFSINTTLQKEDILSNYRYSDVFIYPRGYDFSLRRDEFFKVGFNYGLPLIYPDRAISGLAFIKRIKANFFYDYARFGVTQFPFNTTYTNISSTGIELGFDIRALRLLEIDFGVRYSYLLNDQFAPNGQRHQFDFFVISITE